MDYVKSTLRLKAPVGWRSRGGLAPTEVAALLKGGEVLVQIALRSDLTLGGSGKRLPEVRAPKLGSRQLQLICMPVKLEGCSTNFQ